MFQSIFVWTIGDVIGLLIVGLFLVVVGINHILTWIRKFRCPHNGKVRETMSCDAVCCKCGKNLGFIGTWRKNSQK